MPAKAWPPTFLACFIAISAMLAAPLATPIPYSGLSRIDRLPDHRFGWVETQHALTRDFYFPNDTHLSMHGQFELGESTLNEVCEKRPEPPSRHPVSSFDSTT